MKILGIDPGTTGGLALVIADGSMLHLLGGIEMPLRNVRTKKTVDGRACFTFIDEHLDDFADVAVVELVSNAKPAGRKQGATSMFTFGRMFGAAEIVAEENARRLEYVTPTMWKAKLGLSKDKRASYDLAVRMFGRDACEDLMLGPRGGIKDGVAEAALLAAYYARHVA